MNKELFEFSAVKLGEEIKSRRISCVEVVKSYIERIKNIDSEIKSFVTVLDKEAVKQAEEIDKKISSGEKVGSLAGVPVAIKDNMMITGIPTTCSSKILKNYVAPYDATVIRKLKDEGVVFIGKTNLDEFAMGSSTENSAFFTTKNPWNTDCIPGGSSGGSAACVSARMAPVS